MRYLVGDVVEIKRNMGGRDHGSPELMIPSGPRLGVIQRRLEIKGGSEYLVKYGDHEIILRDTEMVKRGRKA